MAQSELINVSERASLDLNLALREILGAIIGILGYIILIVSAKQDIIEILQSQSRTEPPSDPAPAPRTVATSSLFLLAASLILSQIAITRLKEREIDLQTGITTPSIVPNINITIGSMLSVLGNIFKSIGTQQRASEPTARVTII
jgi:hypothetical protein